MTLDEIQDGIVFEGLACSYDNKIEAAYSGTMTGPGTIAVRRDQIPLGSILQIVTNDENIHKNTDQRFFYGIAQDVLRIDDESEEDLTIKIWSKEKLEKHKVNITILEAKPASNSNKLRGVASAYYDTKTSTGAKAQVGVIAVDPNVIPYGTKLIVRRKDGKPIFGKDYSGQEGLHDVYIGYAQDTGPDLKDGNYIVNLFMPEEQAEIFNTSYPDVEVLIEDNTI